MQWYKWQCRYLRRTEPSGAAAQPNLDDPAFKGFVCHGFSLLWFDGWETLAIVTPLPSYFCSRLPHEQCVGIVAIRLCLGKATQMQPVGSRCHLGVSLFPVVNTFSLGKKKVFCFLYAFANNIAVFIVCALFYCFVLSVNCYLNT